MRTFGTRAKEMSPFANEKTSRRMKDAVANQRARINISIAVINSDTNTAEAFSYFT